MELCSNHLVSNVTLTGYLKAMHVAENTILVLSNGQAENLQGRKGPDLESPSLHTHSTAA